MERALKSDPASRICPWRRRSKFPQSYLLTTTVHWGFVKIENGVASHADDGIA